MFIIIAEILTSISLAYAGLWLTRKLCLDNSGWVKPLTHLVMSQWGIPDLFSSEDHWKLPDCYVPWSSVILLLWFYLLCKGQQNLSRATAQVTAKESGIHTSLHPTPPAPFDHRRSSGYSHLPTLVSSETSPRSDRNLASSDHHSKPDRYLLPKETSFKWQPHWVTSYAYNGSARGHVKCLG